MNLQNILSELGITYRSHGEHHHVTEGWLGIDCPFCSQDSGRFRLGIRLLDRPYCTCWTCGYHRLGETLYQASGKPVDVVYGLLSTVQRQRGVDVVRPRTRFKMPVGVGQLRRPHEEYLQSRGFDPDKVASLWDIRGIGIAGRLSWRLWIPIHRDGEMVSWTTRAIGSDVGRRYINASMEEEAVPAKQCLYGADHVRHVAIVCEGPMDVWAVGPGAVATMGVLWTAAQIKWLSSIPVRVVLLDRDAKHRANKLLDTLEMAGLPGRTEMVTFESGDDPASADPDEIAELRRKYMEN